MRGKGGGLAFMMGLVVLLAMCTGVMSAVPALITLAKGVRRVRSRLSLPPPTSPSALTVPRPPLEPDVVRPPAPSRSSTSTVPLPRFEHDVVSPAGEDWLRYALLGFAGSVVLGGLSAGLPGAFFVGLVAGASVLAVGLPVVLVGVLLAQGAARGMSLIDEQRVIRSQKQDPGAGHVAVLDEAPEAAGALSPSSSLPPTPTAP